jgi:hypothetical protein
MLLTRINGVVAADHSQYLLCDRGSRPDFEFTTGGTGLIGTHGEWATVCTGTEYGPVRFTVETHDCAPEPDLDGWDEIVDVTFDASGGVLDVFTLMSGPAGEAELPWGGGDCWLRLHARGRDIARNGISDAEEHLIAIWPADAAAGTRLAAESMHAVVHKATDRIGAYYRHSEARRPDYDSTVEFRRSPSEWSITEWARPSEEPGVRVPLEQELLRSEHLDVTVPAVTVYPTGVMIHLKVHARQSGMDGGSWARYWDIARHGFGFPGPPTDQPPHPEALRLTVAWSGQSPIASMLPSAVPDERPGGPTLVGSLAGSVFQVTTVDADHQAWLWPRPPALPLQLTVEWPALGVAPTTVTLNGATIAGAHEG